jgi:hypothetical protein
VADVSRGPAAKKAKKADVLVIDYNTNLSPHAQHLLQGFIAAVVGDEEGLNAALAAEVSLTGKAAALDTSVNGEPAAAGIVGSTAAAAAAAAAAAEAEAVAGVLASSGACSHIQQQQEGQPQPQQQEAYLLGQATTSGVSEHGCSNSGGAAAATAVSCCGSKKSVFTASILNKLKTLAGDLRSKQTLQQVWMLNLTFQAPRR